MFSRYYQIPIKSIRYHFNTNKQKYTKQNTKQTRCIYTEQKPYQHNQKPPKNDSNIPYIIFCALFILYDTYRRNRPYSSKRK